MYWRGWVKDVPQKVADLGNNIIMSPTSHCYFDYTYEKISTERVYSYNPVPPGFGEKQSEKVLGVQANFWSHLDRTPPRIDRQLFPRLLALAEVAWTSNNKKDWNDFKVRLQSGIKSLDILGISYTIENY
jgi:hexosaminidase